MNPAAADWVAGSPDETRALGERLGRLLQAGDVIALHGDLGAGKTTFAQGLAQGLGVPTERNVCSPTFALVAIHPGRLPFVHADLYRISDVGELAELGLADAFADSATAIEWASRFPALLPEDHLEVRLTAADASSRSVTATAHGPRSQRLLARLRA